MTSKATSLLTSLAVGLSLLGAAAMPHAAGVNAPILNGLTLGQTDLTRYVAKMRPTCPGLDFQLNAVALVPTACYKLPGDVVILMSDPVDPKHVAVSAAILYKKDPDDATFRKFYDALKKKYGKPEVEVVNDLTKLVKWRHRNMYVMLQETPEEPQGQLCYAEKTFWDTRVEKDNDGLNSML